MMYFWVIPIVTPKQISANWLHYHNYLKWLPTHRWPDCLNFASASICGREDSDRSDNEFAPVGFGSLKDPLFIVVC